ncbi:MAG: hypothetical protein K6C95_03205, partial [Lachnospiraceae bacterium]|nr:hypothetical protein [Lachnospiraceae bacterium]
MVNTKVNSKDPANRLTDIDPLDIFDLADPRNKQILFRAGLSDVDGPGQATFLLVTWLMSEKKMDLKGIQEVLKGDPAQRERLGQEFLKDIEAHPVLSDGRVDEKTVIANYGWYGRMSHSAMDSMKSQGLISGDAEKVGEPGSFAYDYVSSFLAQTDRWTLRGRFREADNYFGTDCHSAFAAGYGGDESFQSDRKISVAVRRAGDYTGVPEGAERARREKEINERHDAEVRDLIQNINFTSYPEIFDLNILDSSSFSRNRHQVDNYSLTIDNIDKWTQKDLGDAEKIFDRIFAPLIEKERELDPGFTEQDLLHRFRMEGKGSTYGYVADHFKGKGLSEQELVRYSKAAVLNRMVLGTGRQYVQEFGKAYGSYRARLAHEYVF